MANDGLQRSAMDRSTFLFSVTSSAGQLWPVEAKFGQPRLAKAVLMGAGVGMGVGVVEVWVRWVWVTLNLTQANSCPPPHDPTHD